MLDARDRQPGVPHVLEYFLEALILAWEVYSPDYHTLQNVYDYNEEIRLWEMTDSDNCGDVLMVNLAAVLYEKFTLNISEILKSPELLDFKAE